MKRHNKKNTTVLWRNSKPQTRKQRRQMMSRCGKKCFLGPKLSFPICSKNTCKRNPSGIMAAFKRARQYLSIKGTQKYRQIANKAKKLL